LILFLVSCKRSPDIFINPSDCGTYASPDCICITFSDEKSGETGENSEHVSDIISLSNLCTGDNDGSIEQAELPFVLNAEVYYTDNQPGTSVFVNPDAKLKNGVQTWDFSEGPDDLVIKTRILDPKDFWFSSEFSNGSYAAPIDPRDQETVGVFRVDENAIFMLGLADTANPSKTLLKYKNPVKMFDFPLSVGKTWNSTSEFSDAVLKGLKNAGSETYSFQVDDVGMLILPDFTFKNVLRIRVNVHQKFIIGGETDFMMFIYVTECIGELARMTSINGEKGMTFNKASEFRRLGM
jgi:hypothetical protein